MNLQELFAQLVNNLRGMWRFRWRVVIVAWLIAIPGWVLVYYMPDVFEASAKVSLDTNSLLPELTEGLTANEDLLSEVAVVSRVLLTRPNLAQVARKTDLDLRADTPQAMEILITGLQQRVSVAGGRDNVFEIAYQDKNREKATDVVAALLNTFVESSLGAQGDDADMTEKAIKLEMEDHEERLLKAEADLAEFKQRNLGYMPEDGADYYTRLQMAMGNVAGTERAMRQLKQRRDEIARQLEGEEPVFGLMPATPAQATAGCSRAANIAELQGNLSQLQVDFTDKHPRIVMLKETIAALEEECKEELEAMGGVVTVVNPETNSPDANPVYQNLRMQLSNANVDLAALTEQYNTAQRDLRRLREDVDKISRVETELKRLNRDYEVVADRHQELLRRWETLQSKRRLAPVTKNVQFLVLEPPFAAAKPVAPNRPMLLFAVLVLALGAGGAVAFGLNQLKPVYYNKRTLSRAINLPVLGTVSMIMSPREISVRRRKTFAWASANLVLLITTGAVIVLADPVSEALRNLTRSLL